MKELDREVKEGVHVLIVILFSGFYIYLLLQKKVDMMMKCVGKLGNGNENGNGNGRKMNNY